MKSSCNGSNRARLLGGWLLACVAGGPLVLNPVLASDAHGEHAAKPVAKASTKSAAKEAAEEPGKAADKDSAAGSRGEGAALDSLRDRLNTKLAETRTRSDHSAVMRVTNSGGHASAAAKGTPKAMRQLAAAHAAVPAAATEKVETAHAGGAAGHAAHWSYGGEGGPAQWGGLKPEFATCGLGNRQSPIDIRGSIRVDLEPIRFDYRPSTFSVIDNGHTVQANIAGNNSIEVGGRRYDLLQFHFHRPSEERINGRQYDMVVHLVHKDPEGRLAVIAVMLEQGRVQPAIQAVWNNLPLEKNQENPAAAPLDVNLLLPEDRRYFTYMGSLTTPPCSEGVLWMVMKQPVPISPEQVGIFARMYPMNARPIQASSGRLIKESN